MSRGVPFPPRDTEVRRLIDAEARVAHAQLREHLGRVARKLAFETDQRTLRDRIMSSSIYVGGSRCDYCSHYRNSK